MTAYFPELLQKKYKKEMDDHPLRAEIIATQMANSIVNRMGPTYVLNQSIKTGTPACTTARVYFVVREVFELRDLYAAIESLDNKVPAESQLQALDRISNFIDYVSSWFLKHYKTENLKENELLNTGEKYHKAVVKLLDCLEIILPQSSKDYIDSTTQNFIEQGYPKDTAYRLAILPILNTAADIIRISDQEKHDLQTVAKVYHRLNETMSFVWLREKARTLQSTSRWETETLKAVVERFYVTQAELTKRIVREVCNTKSCPVDPVKEWITANENTMGTALSLIEKVKSADEIDFAMLTSIEIRLEQLV
jgi:glutamate dehydrogenase